MTYQVLEIASTNLKPGVTEAELLAASAQFQDEFVIHQPGFVSRKLVRAANGGLSDVIVWETAKDAEAVMQAAATSPACAAFFALIDGASQDPTTGVAHYTILQDFTA